MYASRLVILCVYVYSNIAVTASQKREKDVVALRTAKDIVRIIDECPSYINVLLAADERNQKKFHADDEHLSRNMRLLQPTSLVLLRNAVGIMMSRTVRGTVEYNNFIHEMTPEARRRFPNPTEDKLVKKIEAKADRLMYNLLWLDRYLFDAPGKDRSKVPVPGFVMAGNKAPDSYTDTMFPVIVIDGAPRLNEGAHLELPNGAPPQPCGFLEEFAYYSSHYTRRKRWW